MAQPRDAWRFVCHGPSSLVNQQPIVQHVRQSWMFNIISSFRFCRWLVDVGASPNVSDFFHTSGELWPQLIQVWMGRFATNEFSVNGCCSGLWVHFSQPLTCFCSPRSTIGNLGVTTLRSFTMVPWR